MKPFLHEFPLTDARLKFPCRPNSADCNQCRVEGQRVICTRPGQMKIYLYHGARYGPHPVQLSFGLGTNASVVRKPLCLLCRATGRWSTLPAPWVKTPTTKEEASWVIPGPRMFQFDIKVLDQFEIRAAKLSCCGKNGSFNPGFRCHATLVARVCALPEPQSELQLPLHTE